MKSKKTTLNFLFLSLLVTCSYAQNIPFPSSYQDGILYFKNDRGNITEEVFVDKEVIKQFKKINLYLKIL